MRCASSWPGQASCGGPWMVCSIPSIVATMAGGSSAASITTRMSGGAGPRYVDLPSTRTYFPAFADTMRSAARLESAAEVSEEQRRGCQEGSRVHDVPPLPQGEGASGQKVNRVLMKFDLCSCTMASSSRLLASVCLAAIIERIENERSASVTDKRAFGRILAAGEREHVRPALALAVDVDAADLIDQRIDQLPDPVRVGAEDRHLLAVLGGDDVFERGLDVARTASRERSGRTAPRGRASCPPVTG